MIGIEEAAEGRPGAPRLAVGVGGRLHVGPGRVHLRVDGEGGDVDRPVALDDLALVVHEDQVGGPDQAEREAEGVDPEAVGALRVAGGEVAGHALVEAEAVEQAEGGRHALLDVGALLVGRGEHGEACAVGWVSRRPPAGGCRRILRAGVRPWPGWRPARPTAGRRGRSTRVRRGSSSGRRPTSRRPGARGRRCRAPTGPRRRLSRPGQLAGDRAATRATCWAMRSTSERMPVGLVAALGRVLDHEAVEVRLPLDEPDVGVDRRPQQLEGGGVRGERGRDRGEQIGREPLGDGVDEAVAIAEVSVQDRLGDAAGPGELLHRDAGARARGSRRRRRRAAGVRRSARRCSRVPWSARACAAAIAAESGRRWSGEPPGVLGACRRTRPRGCAGACRRGAGSTRVLHAELVGARRRSPT